MAQDNFTQLLQFFKILGNESRLQIVGLLANGERSVGELADALRLTEPTVSHHLAMMKEVLTDQTSMASIAHSIIHSM